MTESAAETGAAANAAAVTAAAVMPAIPFARPVRNALPPLEVRRRDLRERRLPWPGSSPTDTSNHRGHVSEVRMVSGQRRSDYGSIGRNAFIELNDSLQRCGGNHALTPVDRRKARTRG